MTQPTPPTRPARPTGRAVFEYAVLRVVPRIERGEQVNAGVILYCQDLAFLAARTQLDEPRLLALDPKVDLAVVRATLRGIEACCAGGAEAGEAGRTSPGQRFRWLTSPRSTVVQPGPVHAGLTTDPAGELDRLMELLVL